MDDGFITLSRRLTRHWLWQRPEWGGAWVDLLLRASWNDYRYCTRSGPVELGRGELLVSHRMLAKRWGWSLGRVQRLLKLLLEDEMISIQREIHEGTVYRIVNYDRYQTNGKATDTPMESVASQSRVSRESVAIQDQQIEQREQEEQGTTKALVSAEHADTPVVVGRVNGNGKAVVRLVGLRQAEVTSYLGEVLEAEDRQWRVEELREAAAAVVFSYWAHLFKHPNARLDQKRLHLILRHLRANEDNVSFLLYALKGARDDDWIMGRDARSTKRFDKLETIFRDQAQLERFAEAVKWTPGKVHPLAAKYLLGEVTHA